MPWNALSNFIQLERFFVNIVEINSDKVRKLIILTSCNFKRAGNFKLLIDYVVIFYLT